MARSVPGVSPRGPGLVKTVQPPGAPPNANGDKALMRRPPHLRSSNTRDYGKRPKAQPAPLVGDTQEFPV